MAESSTLSPALLSPIGVPGLRQWGGLIDETSLAVLRDPRRRQKIYKDMMTEPLINASLWATELIMRQVPIMVTPAIKDDLGAIEAADWLHGALFEDTQHSWSELLSEILTMRAYGWSVHDIIYKQRRGPNPNAGLDSRFTDGKYGWADFEIRGQDTLLRWEFDERQRMTAMIQQPDTGGTFTLPAEKLLLFRFGQHKGNPEGVSLLANVYRPWYRKQRILEFQDIGVERDLVGYPVLYLPAEVTDPAASLPMKGLLGQYQQMIQSIRRNENEGAIFPSVYDQNNNKLLELELLSTKGGGARRFDLVKIIEARNLEILMALFTDLLLLGHEQSGSWSLSSDKTSMLGYALSAMLDSICGVFNRYAIPRLWRLNGFAPEMRPVLAHGDIESANLAELGKFATDMSTAGLDVLSREAEIWQRAGFTTVEEETAA